MTTSTRYEIEVEAPRLVYMCFDARLPDGSRRGRCYLLFSVKTSDLLSQKNLAPELKLIATYGGAHFPGMMGCGLWDKKIILAGGFIEDEDYVEPDYSDEEVPPCYRYFGSHQSNDFFVFDTTDKLCRSFEYGGSMLAGKVEPFIGQSSTGDKLYVFCGRNNRLTPVPFEALDTQTEMETETGGWTELPEPWMFSNSELPYDDFCSDESNSFNYAFLRNHIIVVAAGDSSSIYAYNLELNEWFPSSMFGNHKYFLPFKGTAAAIEDYDPLNPILISFSGGFLSAHLLRSIDIEKAPVNMKTELLAEDLTPRNYKYASFVNLGNGTLCLVTSPDHDNNVNKQGVDEEEIYVITFRVIVKIHHRDAEWNFRPSSGWNAIKEEDGFLGFELLSKYSYHPSRLSLGLNKTSRCIGCFAPRLPEEELMANSPTPSPEAHPREDLEDALATLTALFNEGMDAVFSSTSRREELKKSISLLEKSQGFLPPSQLDAAKFLSSSLDSMLSSFDQNSQLKARVENQMTELILEDKLKSVGDNIEKATARREKLLDKLAHVDSYIAEARGELENLKEERDSLKAINPETRENRKTVFAASKKLRTSQQQILSLWNCSNFAFLNCI